VISVKYHIKEQNRNGETRQETEGEGEDEGEGKGEGEGEGEGETERKGIDDTDRYIWETKKGRRNKRDGSRLARFNLNCSGWKKLEDASCILRSGSCIMRSGIASISHKKKISQNTEEFKKQHRRPLSKKEKTVSWLSEQLHLLAGLTSM
jgi:hypothetical protein